MGDKKVGIALIISAMDRASATINRITTNAVNKLDKVQQKSSKIANAAFSTSGQLITGGLALGAPIVYAAKKAMEFEDAMAGVAKVTNTMVGSNEFKLLGRDVNDVASYLAKGNIAAANMYQNLAQGGTAKDELKKVAVIAGEAAVAFDILPDIAGDRFVKMKNAMNLSVSATKEAFDSINFLSDKSAASAGQLLDFMAAGGAGVARTLKMSAQEMQAYGTVLIEQGKGPEGTATIFERLQKGIYKSKLAFDIYKKAGEGSKGVNAVLQSGMSIKDDRKRNEYFRSIAGEYSTDVMQLARSNDQLQKYLVLVADKQNYVNSAHAEFANKSKTSLFQTERAKANFEKLGIIIGNDVLPMLNRLIEKTTPYIDRMIKWTQANKPLVTTIIKVVAGMAALSLVGGGLGLLFGGLFRGASLITGGFKNTIKVVKWLTDSKKGLGHHIFLLRFRLMQVSQFMTTKAFPLLLKFGKFLSSNLFSAFTKVTRAISTMSRVLMANPIILIIAGIALAAYVIYKNWDGIKKFFIKTWDTVKKATKVAWEWIKKMFLNYTPQGLIIKHWSGITAFFGEMWEGVKLKFHAAVDAIKAIGKDFWNAGKNIITSVWEGMKSVIHKPVEAVQAMVQKIRDHLPFSPAKIGPLKDIHRIKLIETIAGNIRPDAMIKAWHGSMATFNTAIRKPGQVPALATAGGGGVTFVYNPVIHLSGTATTADANNLASMGMKQFERMMQRYQQNQQRRSLTD